MNHPDFGKVFPCECQRAAIEQRRFEKLLGSAGIPTRFAEFSFDTFLPYHCERYELAVAHCWSMACGDAVANAEGEVKAGLLLTGFFGVGKTGLAAATANARLEAGTPVLWIDYMAFIRRVQDTYGEEGGPRSDDVIDAAQRASFLVIDDLGDIERKERDGRVKPLSDDQRRILYELIRYRHQMLLPTLITTNLSVAQLEQQTGPRIYQRIVELCHIVEIAGKESLRKLPTLSGGESK